MRTLELNKTRWYMLVPDGVTDATDLDGNYTGDKIISYAEAVAIDINVLPSNGDIIEELFGKDDTLDMIAISNDIILTKDTILTDNLISGKEYKVVRIVKTLNTYVYGLKGKF